MSGVAGVIKRFPGQSHFLIRNNKDNSVEPDLVKKKKEKKKIYGLDVGTACSWYAAPAIGLLQSTETPRRPQRLKLLFYWTKYLTNLCAHKAES